MGDTFRPGDLLYVVPYAETKIRCGDVIVFIPPDGERKIVHRVVSVAPQGVRTKGDHSWKEDRYVLQAGHIIGRVMYAKGERGLRKVAGGGGGKWCAWKAGMARRVRLAIFSWIAPAARRIMPLETFRRAMRGKIPTRMIAIQRPGGTELQLLLGRAVMGRILPGRNSWDFWWPFRLFVSDTSLPPENNLSKL
jgi:hypothetical protein